MSKIQIINKITELITNMKQPNITSTEKYNIIQDIIKFITRL